MRNANPTSQNSLTGPDLSMSENPSVALPPTGIRRWILAARPKTLLAAVSPVLLGIAFAIEADAFHLVAAICALVAAVLIQIGTNLHNDYHDFMKGADTEARKGPVRVTQSGLIAPESVRRAAILTFGLAFLVGLYLVWRGGWPILLIGVASIAFGILYTAGRYSLAYLGIADFFVLIFFGPVAVAGTVYVQSLELSPLAVLAGFGPGFLSTGILLVNNIRDIDEDREAGKKTLVVRLGRRFGVRLYAACIVLACVVVVAAISIAGDHLAALAALVISPFGLRNAQILYRRTEPSVLNPILGTTAKLLLIYCILFGIGWLI